MNLRISNFTYVSTQTLQNAFPERAEQRPPQMTSQPVVAVPKMTVSAESKKQTGKSKRRKS